MSFLKEIVSDMLAETAQSTFVNKIHEDTGVPVEKLNEVFHSGMTLMTNPESDPIILGKFAVYKYLDEIGAEEYVSENVIPIPPHKQDVRHCTCPYDPEDDEKDVGTDPRCPIHGVEAQFKSKKIKEKRKLPDASITCQKCKGDGCRTCDFTGRKVIEDVDAQTARWNRSVDNLIAVAMKKGDEPKDLQAKGERLERIGDPKAAIYMDAAEKYAKMDVYSKDFKGGRKPQPSFRYESEGDEELLYQIYDTKTKEPIGKPSKHRRRLANRCDKLDNEYGAVRYVVRPVK